jgi:pimeloyl-ACP methyl ester carboxylesterase
MTLEHISSVKDLVERCNNDGEFRLAARFWCGGLVMEMGEKTITLGIDNGVASTDKPAVPEGVITLKGPVDLWEPLLSMVPPRFFNDLAPLVALGMVVDGNPVVFAQYYAAIMRVIELLRPQNPEARDTVSEPGDVPRFDTPVGRYIHIDLDGHDHRIYFEEAGQGIPLLLQHTAGCHGSQWRHLFEVPEITSRFRLIAYDLPYHGKSLPPVGKRWWEEEYRLTGEFARLVPVAMAKALNLDHPVFMGCSVGGALALDLAYHYPDLFRAVISLEGALRIGGGDEEMLAFLWHPQVSNEFKARLMHGLTSPTSPEPYRKETCQVYAAGWPPVFLGDLYYYTTDFDLRGKGQEIDTGKVGVHILSGEYDFSGTMEMGKEAHEAITGSTWTVMKGLGHFPMSEDPERFLSYLLPVLDGIIKNAK